MPLGELLCDYTGNITSVKVLPFEGTEFGAKYEVTQTGTSTGKLSISAIGSNYVQVHADGTSTTKYYGIWTPKEGDPILVESGGMSVPLGDGRVRFGTTVKFRTRSEQYAWLNTTMCGFEGEGNFSTMEISGQIYEWK